MDTTTTLPAGAGEAEWGAGWVAPARRRTCRAGEARELPVGQERGQLARLQIRRRPTAGSAGVGASTQRIALKASCPLS